MVLGVTLGILAAFLWSLVNIVDKYLVEKYCKDTGVGALIVLSSLFPLVLLPIAYVISAGAVALPVTSIGVLILSGMLTTLWIALYLHALDEEEVSTVMALFQLTPVFAALFAFVVLREVLTTDQLLAGGTIVLGSLVLCVERFDWTIRWKPLLYIAGASASIALMNVLFKYVAVDEPFWTSIFWQAIGTGTAGITLFALHPVYRAQFLAFIKENTRTILSLNATSESLTVAGDVLFAFAILLAPLAIIQTTEAFQPVFVFLMVTLLSILLPKIITEDLRGFTITQKIVGIVLVVSGSIFLYL